jgi:ABC-2 type transport system permease protein
VLTNIARFEFRYLLRNPLLWVTAALTFTLFFLGMNIEGFELGSEGGLLDNASYATLRNYVVVSMVFMFVTTSFVANVILRDDETGFGPIVRSTRITRFEYVIGRFLGAFAASALCLLVVPLAIWLGSLMPWAPPGSLGPNRLADHLYGYFLIALPNLLIHSAILFALATITRSMMATYLGVIGFVFAFFSLGDAYRDRPQLELTVALADPFAGRALSDAVRYWTVPERNALLPDFTGALLYNRLLWIGLAILFLALAYARYRFADQGMSKRERKKLAVWSAEASPPLSDSGASARKRANSKAEATASALQMRALLWMRTRFEMKQVFLSPAFPVLMAYGLFTTVLSLATQRDPDGRPSFPITLLMIPDLIGNFSVIPMVVAIYYAGELVWRERDRRMHEIVDAAPIPNWAYVVPKTLAMALVLISMLLTTVVAAVSVQLSLGYTELELGKYLLWYVLPMTWDMLLLAALAIFVQAISPHKAVGWGVMVLFMIWQELNTVIEHNLLNYGATPGMPLSDLNGAGSFWKGAWTFRIYWGAFAVLLLVVAHLLWRRGTEIRLRARLAHMRSRLAGAPTWVAAAALMTFIATGAYAYYNTNILNDYRPQSASPAGMAEFERRYWKYHDLPQPEITHVTLDIALDPQERRAVTKGRYRLRNLTQQPLTDVHVRLLDSDLELLSATIAGARLVLDDSKSNYRIYRLDRPMQPGEERFLNFETQLWYRGFRHGSPNTRLIENGTFLNHSELLPVIGMGRSGTLYDPAERRKHGLPARLPTPKLEDLSATTKSDLGRGGWMKSDITVSTSADQTPIAPGRRVSDVTRGGRRTARFVSDAPILFFFSVQSARYAEKHLRHGGVDLAVYYHPAHAWNVDRMLAALAASLDHYQKHFGPYQTDHARIVEMPGFQSGAQAFSGTIAYSETSGFVTDYSDREMIDQITLLTAHELAHQYWGHQIVGADAEGASLLSETLAQYSALMVGKRLFGEDPIRRAMQSQLHRYLGGRGGGGVEPPLARVGYDNYVSHRKSAVAMLLLEKRLGEQAIDRALRTLLARYRFQGPPFPRSVDFINALRAEARDPEQQTLITDLFERVTLWDLKVVAPTAVRRPDGKWDVTVPVEAKKLYVSDHGTTTEARLAEHIEIGLFTGAPGRGAFDPSHVILLERLPVHSGRQVLKFVTDRQPAFAGVDPYNFYIDRNVGDNMSEVR